MSTQTIVISPNTERRIREKFKQPVSPKSAFDATAWRQYFVEFLGTLFFIYVSTGAVVSVTYVGPLNSGAIAVIGLAFGFGLAAMIYAAANISGGHINPAVTIGFIVAKKIYVLKGFFYIFSQLAGAMVGSALLRATTPEIAWRPVNLGATAVNGNVSLAQAVFLEFIITFMLVYTVFATVGIPKSRNGMGKLAPLAIGLSVLAGHLLGAPFTGPSMNPARSFGPAVVSGYWENHWVYWVGPFPAGIIAGLIYKYLLLDKMPFWNRPEVLKELPLEVYSSGAQYGLPKTAWVTQPGPAMNADQVPPPGFPNAGPSAQGVVQEAA
jgi:MIP family channel proteins